LEESRNQFFPREAQLRASLSDRDQQREVAVRIRPDRDDVDVRLAVRLGPTLVLVTLYLWIRSRDLIFDPARRRLY